MKNKMFKTLLIALVLSLFVTSAAACSSSANESMSTESATSTESSLTEESGSGESALNIELPEPFDYSQNIDESGFWEGVKASDMVEPAEYAEITLPLDRHEVTDEQVQAEIDNYLDSAKTAEQITDRAIEDGDTVNIDYVGSIDGVEFEGGSTGGYGTEVTLGVTQYIDDFLEQLIGHKPGEKFDIEVTFPEDYGNQELAGKDAVFAISVNHIVEYVTPELTDAYVAENFEAANGWKTVDEMKQGVFDYMQKTQLTAFLQEYLVENSNFIQIPQELLDYQEKSMFSYYEMQAASYGVQLEQLITMMEGVETREALKEKHLENNTRAAKYSLVMQAIAEKEDIQVTEEEVAEHFKKILGAENLDLFIQRYGKNYLKQATLIQNVLDLLLAKVELAAS